jgi:hypothetical protein
MKKIRIIIIILFFILFIFCCARFYSKGYTITYKLGDNNEYEIKEIYTKKEKAEKDNYYIEIKVGKITYSYQMFNTFDNKRKVISDIIYYDGNYKCLLPVIDNKTYTDLLCYKDNRFYNYNDIKEKEIKLDKFVRDIDKKIYDYEKWSRTETEYTINENGIKLYDDNVINNHYIGITNLKGIYLIDKKVKNIRVFSKDIYNRELSAIVGNYYITVDYNEKTQFRTFYFVDLVTGKVKEEKAPSYISFDSYIQGIVEDKLYIYDKDNEKQYKISVDKIAITEIGNSKKKFQYYDNGEWEKISAAKANKELLFNTNRKDSDFEKFEYVYLDGGKKSGYYYLFEKKKGYYNVYRAHVQNKKSVMYLFQVNNISDVYYIDSMVYYKNKSEIKYYSDATGVKTLLEYSELEFNENLIFGIYKK